MANSDSSSDKDDRQDSMRLPEELDRLDRFDCGLLSGEERGAFLADLYSSRDKRKELSEMFELELLELPEMEQESPLVASSFEKKGRESRYSLGKYSKYLTTLTLLVVVGLTARLVGDINGNFGCGGNRQEDIARRAETPELRETVNELNSDRNDSSDLEERASDSERSNVPTPIMAEVSEEPADAELLFAPEAPASWSPAASAPAPRNGAVAGLKGAEDGENGAFAFKKGRALPEDAGDVLSLDRGLQGDMAGGAPTEANASRRSQGMFMGGGAAMGGRSFSATMNGGATTGMGATSDSMYGGGMGMGAMSGGMSRNRGLRSGGMGGMGAPLAEAPDQDEADVPDSAKLKDAFALYAFFEEPDDSDESTEESATGLDRREKQETNADFDGKMEAIAELASGRHDKLDEYKQRLSELSPDEKESAAGLTLFGVQSVMIGDVEAAEQFFRQAYALNKDSGVALFNLAVILDAVGKESEAQVLYEKLKASDEYRQSSSLQNGVSRREQLVRELQKTHEDGRKRFREAVEEFKSRW